MKPYPHCGEHQRYEKDQKPPGVVSYSYPGCVWIEEEQICPQERLSCVSLITMEGPLMATYGNEGSRQIYEGQHCDDLNGFVIVYTFALQLHNIVVDFTKLFLVLDLESISQLQSISAPS